MTDDVISRQSAIEILGKHCNMDYGKVCGKDCECVEYMALRDWPSAQQWIPCSERLPEKSGKYIVSCKANAYSNITTTAQWQNRYKHWNMTGARSHWRVDAWMPLPSPYREEEHHDR